MTVPRARVSALLVSYNTRDLLLEAIGRLAGRTDVEIVVVDNASTDGSASAVADTFPRVLLERSDINLGFAAGVNRAASRASGDRLVLLNSDASLDSVSLDRMLTFLDDHPRAAAVAPRLCFPDGRPQSNAFRFPGLMQLLLDLFPVDRLAESAVNGRLAVGNQPRQIDHALGACLLIRTSAWRDVGGLDEGYFMYVEEVDWCRRARARDWQIWLAPAATAVHVGGASAKQRRERMFEQLWRSRVRYFARFEGPGYNRIVHTLLRLGLAWDRRRVRAYLTGRPLSRRLGALDSIRRLVD